MRDKMNSHEMQSELILQLQSERRRFSTQELEIEKEKIKELMKKSSVNKGVKSAPTPVSDDILQSSYGL
ncbi:hypothetical protein KKF84_02380 [Myxococcota bacterium]|nr:hypothetical protein [Myxococcota bacterium]